MIVYIYILLTPAYSYKYGSSCYSRIRKKGLDYPSECERNDLLLQQGHQEVTI